MNYYFGGNNVFGYHLVNISIHFVTAFFLFLFIYHTLNLPLARAREGVDVYSVALLSTLLWAINPIQTQAVTFIVQRMASMVGMFYIMSMYFYAKGRSAAQNPTRIILFILCALSALLAFGVKENAIMLPISLFLYDFFLIQGVSKETAKKNLVILLVGALLAIIIVILYFALSEDTLAAYFNLYARRPFTLWERLMTESRVIIFYITLILYPMSTRLSLDHDIAVSKSLFDPYTTILSVLLILGFLIGAILLSKRRPLISFSILFFFLNHILESTVFPLELVFEHRNYIPSMFFFVPIVVVLFYAIAYFSYKRSMQVIITLSIILVIIGEGHATFMRNFTWKNDESLWIDVIEKYPHSFRAHHNLAQYYYEDAQEEKAIQGYKKALNLGAIHKKEEKNVAAFNLALIYFMKKDYAKAKEYYDQALTMDPCAMGANNNLAVLLSVTTKDYEAVFNALKGAIECDPESTQAHSNMGLLLLKKERWDQAIASLKKALDIEPNNTDALEGLGYAYMKKGLLGTAYIYFDKAFDQKPKNIRALLYLAQLYKIGGHEERARKTLSQFLDFIQNKDLASVLDQLLGEESLIRVKPDMGLILPLLSKVYEQEINSLEKNRDFCASH
ncbi:MAG: tetratricopeptide repeat protein [Desulfobacteraceae bacterium]